MFTGRINVLTYFSNAQRHGYGSVLRGRCITQLIANMLQKQFDFLEHNSDVSLVHTNFDMLHMRVFCARITDVYHKHLMVPEILVKSEHQVLPIESQSSISFVLVQERTI